MDPHRCCNAVARGKTTSGGPIGADETLPATPRSSPRMDERFALASTHHGSGSNPVGALPAVVATPRRRWGVVIAVAIAATAAGATAAVLLTQGGDAETRIPPATEVLSTPPLPVAADPAPVPDASPPALPDASPPPRNAAEQRRRERQERRRLEAERRRQRAKPVEAKKPDAGGPFPF